MIRIASFACFFLLSFFVNAQELRSPGGNFVMNFSLQAGGVPTYTLQLKGKPVILPSKLGFYLKKDSLSLINGFEITGTKSSTFDETWTPVWGETKTIRNHYNEMAITLRQKQNGRQ